MSAIDRVFLALEVSLLLALLAFLFLRGLAGRTVTFPIYLGSILLSTAMLLISTRWHTWEVWVAEELIHSVAKWALLLEVIGRAFRPFPRARLAARWMALTVLLLILVSVLTAETIDSREIARAFMPRIIYGTAWLFGLALGLAIWYRIPLEPLHKAILMGLTPYLLVFSAAATWIDRQGWDVRVPAGYANMAAYTVLLVYWLWVAARRGAPEEATEHDAFVAELRR